MNYNSSTSRIHFTLAVTALAVLHLLLEMATGGVRVHYPLMQDDLPAISNWWNLFVLPSMAWFSHGYMDGDYTVTGVLGLNKSVAGRLGFSFLYGAALSASFEFELEQTPLYFLFGLLLGGIFYPIYRAEFILGFVLGMTYTFGAALPTLVISIVAAISLVSHNSALFVAKKFRRLRK